MRKFIEASALSLVFILLAAFSFIFSGLIFYGMWVAQDTSPTLTMRGMIYGLSGMALAIIARRDFKRQRARQREEAKRDSEI